MKNIIGVAGSQGVAAILTFLLTPLYIDYFNNNIILGVWLTIVSLIDSASALDLGIGNGMRNKLAKALAVGNEDEARTITSSCYMIVIPLAIAFFMIWTLVVHWGKWNKWLNVDSTIVSPDVLRTAVLIVGYAVIFQLFFKLISSVLYAMQKAAVVNWLIVASNFLLVIFLFATKGIEIENKILIVAIIYGIFINIPYIIFNIIVFAKEKKLRPSKQYFSILVAEETLKLGLLFFYLTIMSLLTHNTNEILVTYLFNPELVVEYQVYNKVFMLITVGINIINIPIWSASTRELALKNYKWIKKAHSMLCALGGLAFFGSIFLTVILPFITKIWLGNDNIAINIVYCIPFILYVTENAIGGANATIANGCGWLRAQIIFAPVSAIINIPITVLLKYFIGDWTAIVYANVLSLLPITIGQYVYIRRMMNVQK